MSEQDGRQAAALQRPITNDQKAWKVYWEKKGQPWRSEPEIDTERQKYLSERRSITPDIERGIYPFKDIEPKLTRADVEWLLATLEDEPSSVNKGQRQKCDGLDLRGAVLHKVNTGLLSLKGTDLSYANLEEASFLHGNLEGAKLIDAHLKKAL